MTVLQNRYDKKRENPIVIAVGRNSAKKLLLLEDWLLIFGI
jgi:hypothetical protein